MNISPNNSKTQKDFIQYIDQIEAQYFPKAPTENLLAHMSPLEQPDVQLRSELMKRVKKNENSTDTHTDFTSLQIEKTGKVGVGIYSNLSNFCLTLEKYRTNFNGEVEAIRVAFEQF